MKRPKEDIRTEINQLLAEATPELPLVTLDQQGFYKKPMSMEQYDRLGKIAELSKEFYKAE